MSNITTVPNLGYYRLITPTTTKITLENSSNAGGTTMIASSPMLDETGAAISKAIHIGFRHPDGRILIGYVAAGGFSDSTHFTLTGRALKSGGLDITSSNTAIDFDLPRGTEIFPVISAFHPTILQAFARGVIASGGTAIYIGDGTNSDFSYGYLDNVGQKGLFRHNHTTNKAQSSNDGTTWVNMDTAAPSNITVRSVSEAGANNGELFIDTDAGNNLAYKDNTGNVTQVVDNTTHLIPLASVQKYYGADSVGSDSYAITLSPAISAYANGQMFTFKAGTANTGPSSLNVNGKGAVTIKKSFNQDTETGDILQNQFVTVVYDGTNFQMVSQLASAMSTANVTTLIAGGNASALHHHESQIVSATRATGAGTGTQTINHSLGVTPSFFEVTAIRGGNTYSGMSSGAYSHNSNDYVTCIYTASGGATMAADAGKLIHVVVQDAGSTNRSAIASVNSLSSSNIVLNFSTFDTGTGVGDLSFIVKFVI